LIGTSQIIGRTLYLGSISCSKKASSDTQYRGIQGIGDGSARALATTMAVAHLSRHRPEEFTMGRQSKTHKKTQWLSAFEIALMSATGVTVATVNILDFSGALEHVPWLADRIPSITLLLVGFVSLYLILERRSYQNGLAALEQTVFGSTTLQPLGIRQKLDEVYKKYFDEATVRIDIIALTLENAMKSYGKQRFIKKIRQETCEIRILILDPESDLWKCREKDERSGSQTRARSVFKKTQIFFKRINNSIKPGSCLGSIVVKKHNRIPYFAYFRADNKTILGFYYSFTFGATSHTVDVSSGSDISNALERHFNQIWGSSDAETVEEIAYYCGPVPGRTTRHAATGGLWQRLLAIVDRFF
jgi:hypothetical protein